MIIGVPKEIKNNECRVGLIPSSVSVLSKNHKVYVEQNAGTAIGFTDKDYIDAGAEILSTASDIFGSSELIIKVKEPLPEENQFLSPKNTLFTYLHLAGNKENAKNLISTGVTGVAYETVTADDGSLPLLSPMSKIAGQISLVVGQYFLLKPNKGLGTLLGSIESVSAREVSVVGAGVAGTEAIKKGLSSGAHVNVLDISQNKLDELKHSFGSENISYILSNPDSISEAISRSDLVIGSVYVVGKEAPKVITKDMLKVMKPGSVLVDISIDQGGCVETSRPTTHDDPIFIEDEVVHYCVTNMPGAVPLTASLALNEVTLPFIEKIADLGLSKAIAEDKHLANGLNMSDGQVKHEAVGAALDN
jgi:alanine dehydrogenase